ncbi:MAG: hypothetical protein RIQ60_4098 [Pseudomonadota bacterium]|jgi:hypothetical protein
MLLQVLYSVRSERRLVEQIQYNLLFRWFVGLSVDDDVWNHSVFSKDRDRLIEHDADKAYDNRGFVKACRGSHVTPTVAQNINRSGGSAIDARTTRHTGYAISQRKRKCIE